MHGRLKIKVCLQRHDLLCWRPLPRIFPQNLHETRLLRSWLQQLETRLSTDGKRSVAKYRVDLFWWWSSRFSWRELVWNTTVMRWTGLLSNCTVLWKVRSRRIIWKQQELQTNIPEPNTPSKTIHGKRYVPLKQLREHLRLRHNWKTDPNRKRTCRWTST